MQQRHAKTIAFCLPAILVAIVSLPKVFGMRPSVGLAHKVVSCNGDDPLKLGLDDDNCVLEANATIRTTQNITVGSSGTLNFGSHGSFRWTHYVNPSYKCGIAGDHTFLVIEPMNTSNTPDAPLWVFMHGGGAGFFEDDGSYSASTNALFQENADDLLDQTFGRIIRPWPPAPGAEAKQNIMYHRMLEGYRVMAVSMCDHDRHQGQGHVEENNLDAESVLRQRVDGLQAVLSAIDYTLDNFGTDYFWIHGTSAGSMGAWTVVFTLASEGRAAKGAILDCFIATPRLEQLAPTPQEMVEKVGWWAGPEAITPEMAVGGGFAATAILDLYGRTDEFCGGDVGPGMPVVIDGFTNNCEWIHEGLRLAIENTKPNQHLQIMLPGGHVHSFNEAPFVPSVEAWIAAVNGQ